MSASELLYVTYLFCYALLISLESIAVRMAPEKTWVLNSETEVSPGLETTILYPSYWVGYVIKAKNHLPVAQKRGALASTN